MAQQDEQQFRAWYADMASQLGLNPNPDDPSQFYDYRAAFRAGAKPDRTGHWPSQFKRAGHENEIVGGFNTRTGERVPGTKRASESELVRMGWSPDAAARLARTPEQGTSAMPQSQTKPIRSHGRTHHFPLEASLDQIRQALGDPDAIDAGAAPPPKPTAAPAAAAPGGARAGFFDPAGKMAEARTALEQSPGGAKMKLEHERRSQNLPAAGALIGVAASGGTASPILLPILAAALGGTAGTLERGPAMGQPEYSGAGEALYDASTRGAVEGVKEGIFRGAARGAGPVARRITQTLVGKDPNMITTALAEKLLPMWRRGSAYAVKKMEDLHDEAGRILAGPQGKNPANFGGARPYSRELENQAVRRGDAAREVAELKAAKQSIRDNPFLQAPANRTAETAEAFGYNQLTGGGQGFAGPITRAAIKDPSARGAFNREYARDLFNAAGDASSAVKPTTTRMSNIVPVWKKLEEVQNPQIFTPEGLVSIKARMLASGGNRALGPMARGLHRFSESGGNSVPLRGTEAVVRSELMKLLLGQ